MGRTTFKVVWSDSPLMRVDSGWEFNILHDAVDKARSLQEQAIPYQNYHVVEFDPNGDEVKVHFR